MNSYGSFSGNPKTEWLVDKNGEDRDMKLTEEFWYIDPDGKQWTAPKDTVINGASIPRCLWIEVGSPYTGDYRRASIVHDAACDKNSGIDRKDADEMFYHACLAGGCSKTKAFILYIGVCLGAYIQEVMKENNFTAKQKGIIRYAKPISDNEIIKVFNFIKNEVSDKSIKSDLKIESISKIIKKHLKDL